MSNLAIGAASVLRGTIQIGADGLEYRSSFTSGLRFRCLPGCGLCCRAYRIPLMNSDLDRLRKVVDPDACSNIAVADNEQVGGTVACMENGRGAGCCYLDEDLLCSLYHNRPLYCRTYPLIRDSYQQLEMSVDYTCPGVGEGDLVTTAQIEEAFLLESENRPGSLDLGESSASFRVICGSLKAMGVYAEAELMRSVCAELIRHGLSYRRGFQIRSYLEDAAATLARLLSGSGNLLNGETAAGLVEGVEEALAGKPGETTGIELSDGAAESLADYLGEWIRRQALLRFVHTSALARPGKLNVLHSFFAFLVHTVSTILDCAEGLRRHKGVQRVTAPLMIEAIRKNEGPLRSKCASVVSTH